ncbi:hypothetical protein C8R44DRAFT_891981 [Mycena epipterygia]|nr:hypothetical protein C8R44DRAFT_891981 [Mycena epipterygia]
MFMRYFENAVGHKTTKPSRRNDPGLDGDEDDDEMDVDSEEGETVSQEQENDDENPGPDGQDESEGENRSEKSDSDVSESGDEELEEEDTATGENDEEILGAPKGPSFLLPTLIPTNAPDTNSSSSPPTVPTISSTIPEATKRKLDEIISAFPVQATTEPSRKRAKRSPKSCSQKLPERLQAAAKFFMRAANPFMDIGSAMHYGSEQHWGTQEGTVASNTVTTPRFIDRQNTYVKAFDAMFASVPDLLDVVKYIYLKIPEKPENWNQLISMMCKAATSARTNDTAGLKHCLNYVLPDPFKQALLPAVIKKESKSDPAPACAAAPATPPMAVDEDEDDNSSEGSVDPSLTPPRNPYVLIYTHTLTQFLLCNPSLLQKIIAGKLDLKGDDFPSFLWEDGSYDPKNFDQGLLRGELVLRVLRHLWTAPSSWYKGIDNVIPAICNARVHSSFTVIPEMVGYGVIQLFGPSPDDPDDTWGAETLAWFQSQVFGDAKATNADTEAEPTPNAATVIKAQRAARRREAALRTDPTVDSTAIAYFILVIVGHSIDNHEATITHSLKNARPVCNPEAIIRIPTFSTITCIAIAPPRIA